MGFFDGFKRKSSYISNKERMRKIRESGRSGEERFRRDEMFSDIERRHHGKDFVKKHTDWTGKTREVQSKCLIQS